MAKKRTTTRRRRTRRSGKSGLVRGFDTGVMIDVAGAGIATRIIPLFINNIYPLSGALYTLAGAGGGYLTGVLLKRPVLANASIALGIVNLVAPMIEGLISPEPVLLPAGGKPGLPTPLPPIKKYAPVAIDDFLTLNGYTNSPMVQARSVYSDAY